MLYVHHMHTLVCRVFKLNYEQQLYSHTLISTDIKFARTNVPLRVWAIARLPYQQKSDVTRLLFFGVLLKFFFKLCHCAIAMCHCCLTFYIYVWGGYMYAKSILHVYDRDCHERCVTEWEKLEKGNVCNVL